MSATKFLERAELFCQARGDGEAFKEIYECMRQSLGVVRSVRETLTHLYSKNTADLLRY